MKFEIIRDEDHCRNTFYINGEDVTEHVVNCEYKKDDNGFYRIITQLEFYTDFDLKVSALKKVDEEPPQYQSTLTRKREPVRGLKELLKRLKR